MVRCYACRGRLKEAAKLTHAEEPPEEATSGKHVAQDGFTMAQDGPRMAQDRPRKAHDGPKMDPRRWPKVAPEWPQDGPTGGTILPKMAHGRPKMVQARKEEQCHKTIYFTMFHCLPSVSTMPRWPQDGSMKAQDGPRWAQNGPRWAQGCFTSSSCHASCHVSCVLPCDLPC